MALPQKVFIGANENWLLDIIAQALYGGLAGGGASQPKGAANFATSQLTSTGSAAQLVAARPTRTGVLITNTAASGSIAVGGSGVTFAAGDLLAAGQSKVYTAVPAIYVIDNGSAHCVVSVWDEYS